MLEANETGGCDRFGSQLTEHPTLRSRGHVAEWMDGWTAGSSVPVVDIESLAIHRFM